MKSNGIPSGAPTRQIISIKVPRSIGRCRTVLASCLQAAEVNSRTKQISGLMFMLMIRLNCSDAGVWMILDEELSSPLAPVVLASVQSRAAISLVKMGMIRLLSSCFELELL